MSTNQFLQSTVNIGNLRDNIVIQRQADSSYDDNGFPNKTLEDVYVLRAMKRTVSTREFVLNDAFNSFQTLKFITYKRDIDSNMFVSYNGKLYDIKNVMELDFQFIEITCEERKK